MKKNLQNIKLKTKNFNNLLNTINKNLDDNNLQSAIRNITKALEIEPKNHLLFNELGTCYAKLEQYELALHYHNKAASIDNKNAIILTNVGMDLLQLDRLNEAIQFFEFALIEDNSNYLAFSGLTTAYHNSGDINNLYKISIKGIEIFPDKCDFHLNLGIALIYLEKLQEAMYCLDTALILKPNLISAKINQAVIHNKLGEYSKAINIYNNIIKRPDLQENPVLNSVKFNLAFQYLHLGNLVEGWEFYDFGFEKSIPFNQRRKPNRKFKSPTWNGEFAKDKTLMIWREQGLGDEILFLSMIPDLINEFKSLIIECDTRLIGIINNTYPKAIVRDPIALDNEDYDYQIPIGSLCKYLRNDISKFNIFEPWFKAPTIEDNLLTEFFQNNSNKILIGICWRSGLLNHQRNNNYIPLDEWDELFKIPNAVFINLQYGDCENEIIEAEKKFNIKIIRWKHIDLKNNLNAVFNIINFLDFVVTAATAVSSMAYSIGVSTLVFQPSRNWTNLGTNYYPWSNFMKQFIPRENEGIKNTLIDIADFIIDESIKEDFQSNKPINH